MSGVDLIAAERQRQIDAEGWTAEHDDGHTDGSLAEAAAYLASSADNEHFDNARDRESSYIVWNRKVVYWPWDEGTTEKNRIDALVKAGALIVAEIDRLEREGVVSAYAVKIGRGNVTHWQDVPLTTRALATECLVAIERLTGETGEIVEVLLTIPLAPAVAEGPTDE